MRFRRLRLPLAVMLAGAAFAAAAGAEDVRQAIAARVDAQLKAVAADATAPAPEASAAPAMPQSAPGPSPVERGKALWMRKFKDGRTLGSCYPNGGRRVAASYPLYDSRLKRVVTL